MDRTIWFKKIFNKYYNNIRNYIYYLSGDIFLSEDIVQDTFLKLWETDKVNDNTIKPFLFSISRNLYLNQYKKNRVKLEFINTQYERIENGSPEYILEYKEYDERIKKAISKLPTTCRTYFLLNRIDDMKYKDIANSFGVSVKTVEKHISRAMLLLKKDINKKI
ncbi:RNA polymerase sigma-70 factor [Candidatus Dojkabacteria bacterium]|nr:RNA polymerase sigma-70 factor [Candidatus Dojkabacteria bacterium]